MEVEHYAIFSNSKAGKGSALKLLPDFECFLTGKKITYEIFADSLPVTLTGFNCIVIMGGDGTINYVINHFKTIVIPIAFLRCGTGNDYNTLHLGSASHKEQFEIACSNHIVAVDAGTCNGKLFINGVGIGFDGWVVKRNLGKQIFSGQLAYLTTILSLLLFYKERFIYIETADKKMMADIFMLSFAKGKTYGGGFRVAPMAELTDGFLDFVAVKKIGLFNRLRYLPVIEKGKHLQLPFVHFEKAKHIKVTSNFLLQAHLDGEWMEGKEFDILVTPNAFKIKSIIKREK
ncbi:MAG: hypothetical protein H7296_05800 [Bacteroidia bacterium]|nr:hypothetical protein [Bacteroidia bacterium]